MPVGGEFCQLVMIVQENYKDPKRYDAEEEEKILLAMRRYQVWVAALVG